MSLLYGYVIAFKEFKESMISMIVSEIQNTLSKAKKRKGYYTLRNYVEKTFVRWWFDNALYDNIENFLPKQGSFTIDYTYLSDLLEGLTLNTKIINSKVGKLIADAWSTAKKLGSKKYTYSIEKTRIEVYDGKELVDSTTISDLQMERLLDRFIYEDKDPTPYICIEALRYHHLGSLMEHLSIPPTIIKRLKIDIELFGTPMNTSAPSFCSPFPDIEKYFNSQGNFMDYTLTENNKYTFNPPYDNSLMTITTKKLLSMLDNLSKYDTKVYVLCTLPVWDPETQKVLKLPIYGEKFEALDLLLDSPYVYDKAVLRKEEYPYFNYFTEKYVPASHTHILLLSTSGCHSDTWSIKNILSIWKESISS